MRIYVSGPMSHYPGHNFEAFAYATKLLQDAGYDVHDPGEFGIVDGWEWADYLRKDLKDVLEVDGIATLDNWQCSRGAVLEVHVAQALGMPVLPIDVWLTNAEVA